MKKAAWIMLAIFIMAFIIIAIFTRNLFFFTISLGLSGIIFVYVGALTFNEHRRTPGLKWGDSVILLLVIPLLAGVFELGVAGYYIRDVPEFLRKDFNILEGVPSQIIYQEGSGRVSSRLAVVINGVRFDLPNRFYDILEKNQDKQLQIKYLPRTKWYVEIKSDGRLVQ